MLFFMPSLQLVAAMKARALQLGIQKWPLSFSAIDKYPGCSWPEVLGCSDAAYKETLGGAQGPALILQGVFPTSFGMKSGGKKQRFTTVGAPLDDGELLEPYCDGRKDRPELFGLYVDDLKENGASFHYDYY
jgi:hypothetical protein